MKLQIDFDKKSVTLLEEVNLQALVKVLKGLFPENWKDITISQTASFVYWNNPIVIREVRPWWEVKPYWVEPVITCGASGTITYNNNNAISTSIMHNGVCNVDIQY